QTEKDRASAMVVRFMIARRRPLSQVADQTIPGNFELSDAHAGAFDLALVDACGLDVADKIGLPDMLHAVFIALEPLIEITFSRSIAIRKIVRAAKNKLFVVDDVHYQRRVGDGQIFHRRPSAVEQPMVSIERRSKET